MMVRGGEEEDYIEDGVDHDDALAGGGGRCGFVCT